MTSSDTPDTGAGTPPLFANSDGSPCWCGRGQGHTAECVARWSEWVLAGRPSFAASRPATDPAGLDALRASMEAFAAAREADVRANRDAPDNINEIVAAAIRGWLARLPVADGPGPEERP